MLRFNLCDYSDAYIVIKETINVGVVANTNIDQKDDVLRNISPFRPSIIKISTLIDDAANLDIVMHRHNLYDLLEYSDNYSMTSGSLWNYHRNEIDYVVNDASEGKAFKYKTKII